MKRTANGWGLEWGAAAALACLCAAPVLAQAPAKKAAPKPTAPPLTGPGSLNGVWNNAGFKDYRTGPPVGAEPSFKTADGEPVPMQPWAAEVVAKRREGVRNGHPFANNSATCVTDGMPSATGTPPELAIQILENPEQKQVSILYEFFSTFRIIHLDEKHAADPDPTFMGNAVGHWEKDTLVVDTTAVSTKTTIMGVIPHSEDLHIVERLRRTGKDTMEDKITIDDPKTFTKPWNMQTRFKRVPGMQLAEFVCENNRNGADQNGQTSIQLQSSAK